MEHSAEGRTRAATEHGNARTAQEPRPSAAPDRARGSCHAQASRPTVDPNGTWLVVPLGGPHVLTGWTLVGGSLIGATRVAWRHVPRHGVQPEHEEKPKVWLKRELDKRFGRADLPCFIASSPLADFQEALATVEGVRVRVVATVELHDVLAAGESLPPEETERLPVAALNLLVVPDRPASSEARLEILAIASEAKTLALVELGLKGQPSNGTPRPATGMGSECMLVAVPTGGGPRERGLLASAGKHTALGAAVGAAIFEAVHAGAKLALERRSGGASR